jgi:sensor domain CHASE-containing protein
MTLRKKILLFVGLTLVGFLAVLYFVLSSLWLSSFLQLEEESARRNVERMLDALSEELSHLDIIAVDWAKWDDTYAFIEDGNEAYITSNLIDATFVELKINLILYFNDSGQLVFGKAFDLQTARVVPLPEGLSDHLEEKNLLVYHANEKSALSGLLLLPELTLLVASRPILTSEGQGPMRGTLIMGIVFDDQRLQQLARLTHLSLTASRWDKPTPPEDIH